MSRFFRTHHKSLRIYRRLATGSLLFALGVAAVGSLHALPAAGITEEITSQRQALKSTDSLYVEGPADVILRQGNDEYVKVTGLPEQIERMYTRKHGKRLHIEVPRNPSITDLVVIEVQLKQWKNIHLDRKVQRVEWEELRSKALSVMIEGGADVDGKVLMADQLDIRFSGHSQVDIQQAVGQEVSLEVSGACEATIETLSAKTEAEVELSGSGELEIKQLSAEEVEIEMAGSGDIELGKVSATVADLEMAGSGKIDVGESSQVDDLSIEMAGSPKAQVKPLQAQRVDLAIAGSGVVDVTALQSLKISVAGSGKIRYWGNPNPVKKSVMGSASVRHMTELN